MRRVLHAFTAATNALFLALLVLHAFNGGVMVGGGELRPAPHDVIITMFVWAALNVASAVTALLEREKSQ